MELGLEMLGLLTCSFRTFIPALYPSTPLGGTVRARNSPVESEQMSEGVLDEKPALRAFQEGRANLQEQERDEEVPSPVYFKMSHTLHSPWERGLKSHPGQ